MYQKFPIVFHNGSNFDYHFIVELAEKFERQFTCLEENTEKYIIFSVPVEKEVTIIDKKGKDITKTMSYKLQFIDSPIFIASLISNLVNTLAERINKIKCKIGYETENSKCVKEMQRF